MMSSIPESKMSQRSCDTTKSISRARGKVVLCNCDDPTWSAFWRYFHLNFAELGLKKLISTHYDRTEPTYKMEYEGGDDNNVEVGVKTPLKGNGDFRNKECLDLLDECDIVVTNPPFSLFREYVGTLMERGKSSSSGATIMQLHTRSFSRF